MAVTVEDTLARASEAKFCVEDTCTVTCAEPGPSGARSSSMHAGRCPASLICSLHSVTSVTCRSKLVKASNGRGVSRAAASCFRFFVTSCFVNTMLFTMLTSAQELSTLAHHGFATLGGTYAPVSLLTIEFLCPRNVTSQLLASVVDSIVKGSDVSINSIRVCPRELFLPE